MTLDQLQQKYLIDTPLSTLERWAKEMGNDPKNAKTAAGKKVFSELEKAKKANAELQGLSGLKNDLSRAYKLIEFHRPDKLVDGALLSAQTAIEKAIAAVGKAMSARQKIVG